MNSGGERGDSARAVIRQDGGCARWIERTRTVDRRHVRRAWSGRRRRRRAARATTGGRSTVEVVERNADSEAAFVECDVTDVGDLTRAVDTADRFTGIDVTVNNAGIDQKRAFTETAMTKRDATLNDYAEAELFESQVPLRSIGEPRDVANAALFLANSMSKYITAESIVADGGTPGELLSARRTVGSGRLSRSWKRLHWLV